MLFSADLTALDSQIQSNAWIAKYKNYNEYNQILRETSRLQNKLDALKKGDSKDFKDLSQIDLLEQRLHTLTRQEELLRNYKNEP